MKFRELFPMPDGTLEPVSFVCKHIARGDAKHLVRIHCDNEIAECDDFICWNCHIRSETLKVDVWATNMMHVRRILAGATTIDDA